MEKATREAGSAIRGQEEEGQDYRASRRCEGGLVMKCEADVVWL